MFGEGIEIAHAGSSEIEEATRIAATPSIEGRALQRENVFGNRGVFQFRHEMSLEHALARS